MPIRRNRNILVQRHVAPAQKRPVARAPQDIKNPVYQILKTKPNAKVAIIRSVGGIGDVLMTTPCVRHLKEEFPDSRIHYLTDRHSTSEDVYYQLLKNAPFIDTIGDSRYFNKSQFDSSVDISSVCIRHENSTSPIVNRIDIFSKACGIPRLKNPLPFYKVEPQEQEQALKLIAPLKRGAKLLMLHTASFDGKRTWAAGKQIELLNLLERQSDVHVLLSDFNNLLAGKTWKNVTNVTSQTIRPLAAYIANVDLYVGPDSGPMHIAGALGVNAVVIFGSVPPMARINHYPTHSPVTIDPRLPCLGCMYKPCGINFKCMNDLKAETVLHAIEKRLNWAQRIS